MTFHSCIIVVFQEFIFSDGMKFTACQLQPDEQRRLYEQRIKLDAARKKKEQELKKNELHQLERHLKLQPLQTQPQLQTFEVQKSEKYQLVPQGGPKKGQEENPLQLLQQNEDQKGFLHLQNEQGLKQKQEQLVKKQKPQQLQKSEDLDQHSIQEQLAIVLRMYKNLSCEYEELKYTVKQMQQNQQLEKRQHKVGLASLANANQQKQDVVVRQATDLNQVQEFSLTDMDDDSDGEN